MFRPTKIIAIGLNYLDHTKELDIPIADHPVMFIKPTTTIIENGQDIIYPSQSKHVEFEGELAVIIKDKIRNISKEEAAKHIKGYTCANDVTARDLQKLDGQWTRAKSFDTFCPLGPRMVTDIDPTNLNIKTKVNGIVKQDSNTKHMIFNVYAIVAFVSSVMTLMPDDIILTGTPLGVAPIVPGDTVEIEIEGIGILKNSVKKG
jgi:2-keto-4-pentenoate hydratase/2-oxohepta-3-ene-1,7-dioic acid hydratase in catechol pathway